MSNKSMTREQAKDKIMQLYGSLSEDMKQAIDTLLDVPADMMPLAVKAEAMKAYRELTGDYVSRKAVEEITWEEPTYSDKYNVLTEVRDKVRALSPAAPDLSEFIDKLYKLAYERGKADGQEWCTVAPPDVGEYLVTIHDMDEHRTYIDIGEYDEDGWNYKGDITVKAWMPLPTPYKQEGKE